MKPSAAKARLAELSAATDLAFKQGYYCACANIMATHGETVITEDVLKGYGKVNFDGIDSYDVEKLKPIAAEIARKRATP